MGVTDTAPAHYHAVYPAVTAALLRTDRILVGTYVTNPVTRHWSVHSATARGLNELAPSRFFLGIGTGDGAVHAVGLKPAKLADFEAYVEKMRPFMLGLILGNAVAMMLWVIVGFFLGSQIAYWPA